MPDLGNLLNMSSPIITPGDTNIKPGPNDQSDSITPSICDSGKPECGNDPCNCNWGARLRFPIQAIKENPSSRRSRKSCAKNLDDYVKDWVAKKIELGVPETKCFLPFLVGAPKLSKLKNKRMIYKMLNFVAPIITKEGLASCRSFCNADNRNWTELGVRNISCIRILPSLWAECRSCQRVIFPGEEVLCSVRDCECTYHLKCAEDRKLASKSSREFKCPQHVCFLCKQKHRLWRCTRCHLASHDKCAAFPEHVVQLKNKPGQVICWKHFIDWPPEKRAVPTNRIEEIFHCLPLPYVVEEFKLDQTLKELSTNKMEPPPYIHIRRNSYLVKKKHNDSDCDSGCTTCSSNICSDDCVCRVQCVSCSKHCRCSDACTNRPFRKDKKIKVVRTELCGWGVEAAESIDKGDFIIEYIGEVISEAQCIERFWDMKNQSIKNFYMCEIRKDFTIDATYKGNSSRFLNHSCDPNCILEKWQVEGETRLGLFATRYIEVGEPLTYDYRFVQFGHEVKCLCGAANCRGYLGAKKKMAEEEKIDWGTKRPRTRSASRANQ